jgi:hypothetical protein
LTGVFLSPQVLRADPATRPRGVRAGWKQGSTFYPVRFWGVSLPILATPCKLRLFISEVLEIKPDRAVRSVRWTFRLSIAFISSIKTGLSSLKIPGQIKAIEAC